VSFDAVVFRATPHETPLWAFPNFGEGRFNRANVEPPAQYFALHPMAPWAEQLRNLNLRTAEEARAMRMPIWAIHIELADDPVVLDFDTAGGYGLAAEDLVSDDRDACRALAAGLHAGGTTSLLAPSAALPGTTNLTLLEPAVVIDYLARPLNAEERATAMIAHHGRCPEGLWDLVHYRGVGALHPALDAWQNGDEYEFDQPPVYAASLKVA